MNFSKFICINNIKSLDKLFCQFVNDLDPWWLNYIIDLSYETTRIHSTSTHTIIINVDEVLQFSSNNDNYVLTLACLISMENKRTLSNINDHIQIIMCILKFNFIDKKPLKKQLEELVVNNYLMIENTQKIYNLNIENIMKKINIHINTNIYVNKIMSIGRENYCMTAVFYNLPSILNPKHKIKNQNQTNKPYIFNLFQKKIIFIKEFINNILHTHFIKLTTNTIEENYITEINNYKKTLTNLLQVLPKKNYNSSFSTEEILQFIKNKHTVESIHYRPPSTTTVQTVYDLNSFNKF